MKYFSQHFFRKNLFCTKLLVSRNGTNVEERNNIENKLNIIILLILAGVSLSMIAGNDGILSKAKFAKDEYERMAEKEEKEW